jgi:hypothetical protein
VLKKSDVFSAIFILELLELRDKKANRKFLRSIFRKKIIRRTHGEVSSRNEILLAEPFFTHLYKYTSNIYDALVFSLLSTNHNLIETYDITVPELRASLARDSKNVGNAFKVSLLPEYIYTLCVKRIILDNPIYAPQVHDITIPKSSSGVQTKNKMIAMLRVLPLLAKKIAAKLLKLVRNITVCDYQQMRLSWILALFFLNEKKINSMASNNTIIENERKICDIAERERNIYRIMVHTWHLFSDLFCAPYKIKHNGKEPYLFVSRTSHLQSSSLISEIVSSRQAKLLVIQHGSNTVDIPDYIYQVDIELSDLYFSSTNCDLFKCINIDAKIGKSYLFDFLVPFKKVFNSRRVTVVGERNLIGSLSVFEQIDNYSNIFRKINTLRDDLVVFFRPYPTQEKSEVALALSTTFPQVRFNNRHRFLFHISCLFSQLVIIVAFNTTFFLLLRYNIPFLMVVPVSKFDEIKEYRSPFIMDLIDSGVITSQAQFDHDSSLILSDISSWWNRDEVVDAIHNARVMYNIGDRSFVKAVF